MSDRQVKPVPGLWQNLDDEINKMMEHFVSLVKASRIPDDSSDDTFSGGGKEDRKVPGDLLEVWGERLIYSAYLCHHHLSELKKSAALSDYASQVQAIRESNTPLNTASAVVSSEMARIKDEAQALLQVLEASYYSSRHKGAPRPAQVPQQCALLAALAKEAFEA